MRRQEKQKPCRDVIRAFVSGESLHTRTDHMQISLDSASAMNFNETSGIFRYFVGFSHQFFQNVDQKECFRGVFEHHKAHPIYRDISLTIMRRLKLISYWADWAPGIGNIRYYRDILVSIGPLTFRGTTPYAWSLIPHRSCLKLSAMEAQINKLIK